MIARDFIAEWRQRVPWMLDGQVEQDLVLARGIVDLFSRDEIAGRLAFRGGTALYKLGYHPPLRYSEDIDLVATRGTAAGAAIDGVRSALDPWLGEPRRDRSLRGVTLTYHYDSEGRPPTRRKLKVEVNLDETFAVFPLVRRPFVVESRWFAGSAEVLTFCHEELIATKLRALFQRRKGRDLYDVAVALEQPGFHPARAVQAFVRYMEFDGLTITRAMFEANLEGKTGDGRFTGDVGVLLAPDRPFDAERDARAVTERLLALLPGAAWKGPGKP